MWGRWQQRGNSEEEILDSLDKPARVFHRDYYQPMLEKYAFHLWCIQALSKCGCVAMCLDWFKHSHHFSKTIRDYAEWLKFEFNLKIQSNTLEIIIIHAGK